MRNYIMAVPKISSLLKHTSVVVISKKVLWTVQRRVLNSRDHNCQNNVVAKPRELFPVERSMHKCTTLNAIV
jgi:hypothetical protein